MVKKLSLVVALVLMAGSFAKADDSIDLSSISDANNAVVEASIDVDSVTLEAGKNEQAVEACFRGWGGCYNYGYNYGCYNYGYNYGCYNYCYTPCYHTYFVYQPVCSYPLYTWGCY